MKSNTSGLETSRGIARQIATAGIPGIATAAMLAVALTMLSAGQVHALKTNELELGSEGVYDGAVVIQRDPVGRMLFRDTQVTSPTSLWVLQGKALSHATLSGLGADDHPHYLTADRHAAAHGAAANAALPIPADPAGHVTLGDHVRDADLHLRRGADERITGAWTFAETVEAAGARLRLSQNGAPGDAWILFEDGVEDAMLGWSASARAFDFNRPVRGNAAEWSAVTAAQVRADERVSGRDALGAPAAILDGFASIEGIAPADLLARGRDETIAGDWTFQGNVKIEGALEAEVSGPGDCEKKKGRVLSVAVSGGDYTSVQAAINAASSGDVVLIYPGTYTLSSVLIVDKSISLVGIDRESCIIEMENKITGAIGPNSGVLNLQASSNVANLTIRNTEETTGDYTSPAIVTSAGSIVISNCYLGGNGGRDILCVLFTSNVICQNVTVEQYMVASDASHPVWVNGDASLKFMYGIVSNLGTGNGIQINTTGSAEFMHSRLNGNFYIVDCVVANVLSLEYCRMRTMHFSGRLFMDTPNYSSLIIQGNDFGASYFEDLSAESITVANNLFCGRGAVLSGSTGLVIHNFIDEAGIKDYFPILRVLNLGEVPTIEFSDGGAEYSWDTNLYRSAAATLKTDGTFEAGSIAAANVSAENLRWKDWPAANMTGHMVGWPAAIVGDFSDNGMNEIGYYIWRVGTTNADVTMLRCAADGATVMKDIPYEAGTILTRLRVKWQAGGDGDGVTVSLVKRNESGTDTAWTTVGAAQTYTDPSSPYPVTVSTYDFADETMAADHSYAIRAAAKVEATAVTLYAVGIETSKRVY